MLGLTSRVSFLGWGGGVAWGAGKGGSRGSEQQKTAKTLPGPKKSLLVCNYQSWESSRHRVEIKMRSKGGGEEA